MTQNTLEETELRVTAWLERLEANDNDSEEPMQTNTLELTVEGSTFTATLEENSSTQALKERLAQGPLSIRMSDYGDMKKSVRWAYRFPATTDRPRPARAT